MGLSAVLAAGIMHATKVIAVDVLITAGAFRTGCHTRINARLNDPVLTSVRSLMGTASTMLLRRSSREAMEQAFQCPARGVCAFWLGT